MSPDEKLKRWIVDPLFFVVDELGAKPDPWQVEALEVLGSKQEKHQRMAFKACKGPGKTAFLAWAIIWFMATQSTKGEHAKGAGTSITQDNIDDNLWPEIAKWKARSPFIDRLFKWTKTRYFQVDHEETWFFSKRTWPKTADSSQQANTLAGLHAENILFVLDESGGIPNAVMASAEATLSTLGGFKKIIQCGNPTHLEGPLYSACTTERNLWWVKEITGDPDDPQRSPRISTTWARQQIEKYGRDNPWVLVNVFGQFPPSSVNALLGPEEISASMKRRLSPDEYDYAQKRLGVDCARFGDDRTVLFPRQGLMAFPPATMRNARGPEIASRMAQAKARWDWQMAFIDDTGGYGASAIDSALMAGLPISPVSFSGRAIDPRYMNKRAEMWFTMSEWVKRGGVLPDDDELVKELSSPTYTFNAQGKFLLEPKEQIKERLGFSPDKADALALTFAIPEMPHSNDPLSDLASTGKYVSEYNPFSDDRR